MLCGWMASLSAASSLTYISEINIDGDVFAMNSDPYRRVSTYIVSGDSDGRDQPVPPALRLMAILILLSVVACVFSASKSYCNVYRSGGSSSAGATRGNGLANRAKVGPWTVSEATSGPDNGQVLAENSAETAIVYRPADISAAVQMSTGDIKALELPALSSIQRNADRIIAAVDLHQLSVRSIRNHYQHPQFSDLQRSSSASPAGEIVLTANVRECTRLNGSSRAGGATRNGLVMMAVFVTCSLPLFVSSLPGVLPNSAIRQHGYTVTVWLILVRLLFNCNASLFPLWYLLFSGRVRRNMNTLYNSFLKKFNNI